jgi:hypothetical protein
MFGVRTERIPRNRAPHVRADLRADMRDVRGAGAGRRAWADRDTRGDNEDIKRHPVMDLEPEEDLQDMHNDIFYESQQTDEASSSVTKWTQNKTVIIMILIVIILCVLIIYYFAKSSNDENAKKQLMTRRGPNYEESYNHMPPHMYHNAQGFATTVQGRTQNQQGQQRPQSHQMHPSQQDAQVQAQLRAQQMQNQQKAQAPQQVQQSEQTQPSQQEHKDAQAPKKNEEIKSDLRAKLELLDDPKAKQDRQNDLDALAVIERNRRDDAKFVDQHENDSDITIED